MSDTHYRADYGIDAPTVIRNLWLRGSIALVVGVIAYFALNNAPSFWPSS